MNVQVSILSEGNFKTSSVKKMASELDSTFFLGLALEVLKTDSKATIVAQFENGQFIFVTPEDSKPVATKDIIQVQHMVGMKFMFLHMLHAQKAGKAEDKFFEFDGLKGFKGLVWTAPVPKPRKKKEVEDIDSVLATETAQN